MHVSVTRNSHERLVVLNWLDMLIGYALGRK